MKNNRKKKHNILHRAVPFFIAAVIIAVSGASPFCRKSGHSSFLAETVHGYSSEKELTADERSRVEFCKELYYQHIAGFEDLNVDYYRDSLETIALRLKSAGWKFLPDDRWDLSKAADNVPALDGILDDARLLNAVFFLADNKACRLRIVESEKTSYFRMIDITGAADAGGILFTKENGDLDQQKNNWLFNARMKQEQALNGFFPFLVGKTLNTRSFSNLIASGEQSNDLSRITKKYSDYNLLSWDDGTWTVSFSVPDDNNKDRINPGDLTYLSIKHSSKGVALAGNDSEGNINRISLEISKDRGTSGSSSPDAEFQKYVDREKAARGQTIDLSNVYTVDGNQLYFHEDISSVTLEKNGDVTLSLTGPLASRYGSTYSVDSNVLKIYTPHIGNGSWGQLLFLKENGSVDALIYSSLSSDEADTIFLEKNLASADSITDIVSVWGSLYAFDLREHETDLSEALYDARDRIR